MKKRRSVQLGLLLATFLVVLILTTPLRFMVKG
jgi:hypothetical protein